MIDCLTSATLKDLPRVCRFYKIVCDKQATDRYTPRWHYGIYPAEDELKRHVLSRELLLGLEGGGLAAALVLLEHEDEEYRDAPWQYPEASNRVCVWHLFAVSPVYRGRHMGKDMLSRVLRLCRQRGFRAVHLDVTKGNDAAERLYTRLGFRFVGERGVFYEDTGVMTVRLFEYDLTKMEETHMKDISWFEANEARIPKNEVRTRFAPSPTGYMHVGNLRTALYTYLIARHNKGKFILRIEDTDQGRLVEGAVDVIYKTMAECHLDHDEGPDVGGPVAPYVQTERRPYYKEYAELLMQRGHAYRCFCEKAESEEDAGDFDRGDDPCRCLTQEESDRRALAGEKYVIRQRIPHEGTTTFHDEIFGDITVENKTLDDQVLIKRDGLPTYNFANVVDDHLMGITHVVRGNEYLSSAPKYNLLYEGFGWDIPKYVHCSPVMRDAHNKMSKRHGDPSYEDLIAQGFLTDAVLNYVALLGWSPRGEQEIFSLEEMIEVFEMSGISKSPAIFDIEKLRYFNAEYIRRMSAEDFARVAEPFIRQSVRDPRFDTAAIAALLQQRTEVLTEIPEKVDFFDTLPEYGPELFVHKKSKSDETSAKEMLSAVIPAFEALENWDDEHILGCMSALVEKLGVKNAKLMWPVRIAAAGKAVTPGGAVEICRILGKDETVRRLKLGLEKLG